MKLILPLLKGGAKLGIGLFMAISAIGLCVWGYSEWEESRSKELSKARIWEAQDVRDLASTVFLKTKLESGSLHYIVSIESPRRPKVQFLSVLLADEGGFTLASKSIPITNFSEEGDRDGLKKFHAEGVMEGYYGEDLYRRAVKWHVGWKLPREEESLTDG
jgi:hypothetical protein